MSLSMKISSFIEAKKLFGKGCFTLDVNIEVPFIDQVPTVSKFQEVFHSDLPGIPLNYALIFSLIWRWAITQFLFLPIK